MSNRTAIIASAFIAGCVSIISITSLSGPARAEDECLTAPKAATPTGGHWYYRLEKGTKRKCWYLSDAGAKTNKTTAAKAAPDIEQDVSEPAAAATEPTDITAPAPGAKKPMRKSVANARAELSANAPTEDPALADSTWPPLNDTTSNATRSDTGQAAAVPPQSSVTDPSSTQSWTMASRWPEPNSATPGDHAAVPAQEPAQQTPALTADRLVTAAATTGVATPDPAPATTAPAPQAESDTISLGLILSVLVGVLALAAIIGPLIFNYAKPRRRKDVPVTGRRPIWDSDLPQQNAPLFAQDEVRRRPVVLDEDRQFEDQHLDEQQHVADDTADEIEELLRASKRSAA